MSETHKQKPKTDPCEELAIKRIAAAVIEWRAQGKPHKR